jgi:alanine dehydrogenase
VKVGIPSEVKNHEYRVAITPGGVLELNRNGHEVFVQKGAGEGSSISDAEYSSAGATIVVAYWHTTSASGTRSASAACQSSGQQ